MAERTSMRKSPLDVAYLFGEDEFQWLIIEDVWNIEEQLFADWLGMGLNSK